MKKIVFIFLTVIAFSVMAYNISGQEEEISFKSESGNEYKEQYNNEVNINIARKIAVMADAEKIAVVGDRRNVLVGIILKNDREDKENLIKQAEKITREEYKFAKISVEIGNDKTDKILEIAENIQLGMSENILKNKMKKIMDN